LLETGVSLGGVANAGIQKKRVEKTKGFIVNPLLKGVLEREKQSEFKTLFSIIFIILNISITPPH
jgi:hypothetical protein